MFGVQQFQPNVLYQTVLSKYRGPDNKVLIFCSTFSLSSTATEIWSNSKTFLGIHTVLLECLTEFFGT